jgi:hypothetical protein
MQPCGSRTSSKITQGSRYAGYTEPVFTKSPSARETTGWRRPVGGGGVVMFPLGEAVKPEMRQDLSGRRHSRTADSKHVRNKHSASPIGSKEIQMSQRFNVRASCWARVTALPATRRTARDRARVHCESLAATSAAKRVSMGLLAGPSYVEACWYRYSAFAHATLPRLSTWYFFHSLWYNVSLSRVTLS